ncbi:MAG: SDR family NAD(P)-dependent oxidoreductase [Deltaproteobacteria bacterium]|nr:SDR family NAD(P)-dependent oxidoreductase [Deltaproteobacteria bacterium]MBW2417216.1 SDR family NAD(P)-dependent oxidoreductase [Deltaproteobacteria bacterium]
MQTVLITGASSGIGAATAEHLAQEGFRVYGTSRSQRSPSPDAAGVHWLAMDVCDESSVAQAVAQLLADTEQLDALVCNAGFGIFGSVEEVSIEAARQQFDTNYFGVLRVLRAVLPHMRERGAGRIVLVGSLAGRAPIPFQSHYSASKAAVESTVMALRNEVGRLGIRVSLVEPGDINTPFNEAMSWGDDEASPYGEAIRSCEEVIRESLPKAPGPEIVAKTIAKALSAKQPRVRYSVGPESVMVPLGRRLLPDWATLALIRSHFKL